MTNSILVSHSPFLQQLLIKKNLPGFQYYGSTSRRAREHTQRETTHSNYACAVRHNVRRARASVVARASIPCYANIL